MRGTASKPNSLLSAFGHRLSSERAALVALLLFGLLLRSLAVFSGTQVDYPTETFQYFEQGHRLAFGSAFLSFEYDYGIRSWLIPGFVAIVMKLSGWLSSNPFAYIYAVRFIAAVFSLIPIYCGFKMVLARSGLAWATITGFFCAVWNHSVALSVSILPEILAAYLMFPAILIASGASRENRRDSFALGALLGLAFCLRFQMAPALFVIACWFCRLEWRRKWLPVSLTGAAVVCTVSGLLDWVTLGTPFQSIWLNYYLNAIIGIDTSFGQLPLALSYVSYIAPSGAILILVLLWLAVLGSARAPLLAATAVAVLISHVLVAHREYRFIAFFLLALPILIGFGTSGLFEMMDRRAGRQAAILAAGLAVVLVPVTSYLEWNARRVFHVAVNGGVLHAFAVARDESKICGLGIANYLWSATGGYTYFDRDVPIYTSSALTNSPQPGYYEQTNFIRGPHRSPVPLRMHALLRYRTIPQFPDGSLFKNTGAYNYLIVAQSRRDVPAGYSRVGCYANQPGSPFPAACLLHRDGGCTEP